jgi:hypothetical protein
VVLDTIARSGGSSGGGAMRISQRGSWSASQILTLTSMTCLVSTEWPEERDETVHPAAPRRFHLGCTAGGLSGLHPPTVDLDHIRRRTRSAPVLSSVRAGLSRAASDQDRQGRSGTQVRGAIQTRVQRLSDQVPEGCVVCREWPHVWLLGDDDPDAPVRCTDCGRSVVGKTWLRLVVVDVPQI